MIYNTLDEEFIRYWRNLDFHNWNESDIREEFIAPLLKNLGYSKKTVNDVIREKSLNLSTPYHRIGRKKISIDYIPTIRLKSFWIIEAKPGNIKEMDFGDLLQAHLYATHPEVQVPLIVLCNGWYLKVYDALRLTDWNEPIFSINQQNCNEKFYELQEILGVKKLLEYQRKRILENIKNTFAAEIDINQLTTFKYEFNRDLLDMEKLIRENERELEKKVWQEQEKQEEIELWKANPKQLIIHMDILTYHMLRPANEYIRRIEQANLSEKIDLINQLAMYYRGRPHSIFRVNCLYILLSLLKKNIEFEGGVYFKNIKELFEEVAFYNLTYFKCNSLSNSLCCLENTCCRLSKKVSLKAYMDILSKYVVDLRKRLPAEDLIARQPSVAGEMVRLIGMNGEFFWRLFSQENSDLLVWEGIWVLEDFENIIDKLPEKKYPDNNSDLLSFESYGIGFDLLFMGSWMILNENLEFLKVKNVNPNIINYALMNREKAISVIPKSKLKPDDYKFSDQITDKMQGLLNTLKK